MAEKLISIDGVAKRFPGAGGETTVFEDLWLRIDRGEFGEEIKKLPEDERKQRMRELRLKREAAGGNAQ